MQDLFIERFGGIRQANAVTNLTRSGTIAAVTCRNIDLKYTEKAGNVAIFSARGNKAVRSIGKQVVGQFESVQSGVSYHFIYAVDSSGGYLYRWDKIRDTLEEIPVQLSASKACNGITIAQGYDDWFVFTNGIDDYVAICLGQENPDDRVKFLNAYDAEDRDIRGLALEVQNGRLVTACENRVHWSAQGNIFDWSGSDSSLVTIPAYQEFDRPVTAIVLYNNALIAFTEDNSVIFTGNPGNASAFSRSGASGGGCASYRSFVRFDNKLFYYDPKAKNIFAYYLLDSGQMRPNKGYGNDILSFFERMDTSVYDQIEMFRHNVGQKNEIWFKFPTYDGKNVILIYDYLKNEWVERRAQSDIGAFCTVDDILYSASGTSVLRENIGTSFDGVLQPSEYKTTLINLGSDSNIKIPKMPLIMTLDWSYENDFYIEFIYDDQPERSRIRHIVKMSQGYLVWAKDNNDDEGGLWALNSEDEAGGMWVSSDKNTVMFNMDGVMPFKQLQIRIYTQDPVQEFAIKRLEFKRVGLKNKSLG